MGFSQSRAAAALSAVGSNSVEAGLEWLFSRPEPPAEAASDDVELVRALALSLSDGSEENSMMEGTARKEEVDAQPTEEVPRSELLAPRDLVSVAIYLGEKVENTVFPLTDLI